MNKDIIIRGYRQDDREAVQNVCIVTGIGQEEAQPAFRTMLLTAFCNYYIEQEPQNCFVAVDGERVIGYILCTENSNLWAQAFENTYVAETEEENLRLFYRGTMETPIKYASDYPAHLHIDILPEYQRMGIGFQLMDALTAHLRAVGVPGVMLSVAADNEKGKNFYGKYGFTVLDRTDYEIVMGIKLPVH